MNKLMESLEEVLVELKTIYEGGGVPQEIYFKCLICLAYEFFLDNNESRALALYREITPDYFNTKLLTMMAEDADFAYVTYSLGVNLMMRGLVKTEVTHSSTSFTQNMPAAKA